MRFRCVHPTVIRTLLGRLVARVRGFWTLEDPDERIEGSGEVYLDPAYNGRYTAERRLRQLSKAQEEAGLSEHPRRGPNGG